MFSGGPTGSFTIRAQSSAADFDENKWEHFEQLREKVHRNVVTDKIRAVTVETQNLIILPKQATMPLLREALSGIPNIDVLVGIVNSRRQQAPIE